MPPPIYYSNLIFQSNILIQRYHKEIALKTTISCAGFGGNRILLLFNASSKCANGVLLPNVCVCDRAQFVNKFIEI